MDVFSGWVDLHMTVGQEKEPCIGFTQENLIESSVQDCLLSKLIAALSDGPLLESAG